MAHQILMLGGRRSGKSSILASIVYALGQNSELFSITDQTDYTSKDGLGISLNAKRIEIDNYLKSRKNVGRNSHFLVDMSPNRGEGNYNLETQIQGANKVRFDFVDVQGESMEVKSQYHNRVKELVTQSDVFAAATQFARVEGTLPAPESSHAIRVAIDEALKCKETGEAKNIVFGLTGTGYFDMLAYQRFNEGQMNDYIPTDEELAKALTRLP